MLNLGRLRTLHEVARCGTVTAAARVLAYSPSAVSQQLAQLEREAGAVLTERVGRTLVLTDSGRILAEHARRLLEEVERAEADLAAARPALSGVVRVASFQSVMLSLIPAALTDLYARHPDLEVEVFQREVGPAYEGLLSREFDLVMGEEYPGLEERQHAGEQREELSEDPLLLAVQHSPDGEGPRSLQDLADAIWTADPPTVLPGIWMRSLLRSHGIEPRVRFETIDLPLQAHLVRSGLAVALIPGLIPRPHLAGADLFALPGGPIRRIYTSVRTGGSEHPAIRAVRDALGRAVRGIPVPDARGTLREQG